MFDRPIGQNQGIQHPLAERWIELEAATLLYQKAAWLYHHDKPCGAEANAAKFMAGEAGFRACKTSVLTLGGMGYAKNAARFKARASTAGRQPPSRRRETSARG